MIRQQSDPVKIEKQNSTQFKAAPLPKTTYNVQCWDRKSAPPKMTQFKNFNLNTERRGALDRKKLAICEPEASKQFKSRKMPSFP